MRTNDILLDGFNDIRTLQRYLYMSWDEIVSITSANVAQNEYKWANGRYRGSV